MVDPAAPLDRLSRPLWRQVLALALPALAQQYLHLVVQLSDQFLAGYFPLPAGQDRERYLSALNTAGYLYWFVSSYTVVVSVGSTALVALLNVPLAWGLCFGVGPFAGFGFVGIALGTGLSHVIGCVTLLAILARGKSGLKLHLANLLPDFPLIRRLLWVSVPAAIDSLSV